MIYQLEIRARNDPRVPIQRRHQAFCAALAKLSKSWKGLKPQLPPIESPPVDELASVCLTRKLPGVKQAYVTYVSRAAVDDDDMNDDFISLEFKPEKLDYGFVVQKVFSELLVPFGAYVGCILAEELALADFEKGLKNGRKLVQRLAPVCYFDSLLCRRAFGLGPTEMKRLLEGHAEQVRLTNNGVLVIASSLPLDVAEAEAIHKRLIRRLHGKLPDRAATQTSTRRKARRGQHK